MEAIFMKKQANGQYRKRIYIGTDENGKKKYKSVFGKTKKEVEKKVSEIKIKYSKGIDIDLDKDTFGKWIERWKISKKDILTENQYNNYCAYLNHFEPLFNIKMTKLQTVDFQLIINNLSKKNPTTGKPTSKKSLREFKSAARQVFDFAIMNRALDFNPLNYVTIPEAPKKDRRALTKKEQQWIIDTPGRAQLPAMIMMLAGLRLGECLALQWCDIDLKNATIDVHKTVVMTRNRVEIKQSTKTKAGMRIVDMPKLLVDYLKNQPPHSPFDYVITNTKGGLF